MINTNKEQNKNEPTFPDPKMFRTGTMPPDCPILDDDEEEEDEDNKQDNS